MMTLGAFSTSLAVKDLQKSKHFYEVLGFEQFHGDADQGWLIMKCGDTVIGLFQGMFDKNMMTFNPGWDGNAQAVEGFEDVRAIQQRLKSAGIDLVSEADETSTGPANFMVLDPDGNPILFDQHV